MCVRGQTLAGLTSDSSLTIKFKLLQHLLGKTDLELAVCVCET